MKEGLGKRAVAVLAAVALLAAGGALATGSAGSKVSNKLLTYAGQTSFGRPVVLQVRGLAITRLAVAWEASCVTTGGLPFGGIFHPRSGAQPESVDPDLGFLLYDSRLTKRGGFSATGLGTLATEDAQYEIKQTTSGRVKNTSVSGRLRVTADVLDNNTDEVVDSCKTSTFNWSATRAPGRSYGGFTNQNSPVVVQLNKARSTVTALRIAWSAPCADENTIGTGTTAAAIPVTGGRFSAHRVVNGTVDDGNLVEFTYDVEGTVSRSRVSGTFEVSTRSLSGTEVTCTSPSIEWNAPST